jgi:hypothetical protein
MSSQEVHPVQKLIGPSRFDPSILNASGRGEVASVFLSEKAS